MNEYRLKLTIRNNLLLSAIESAGYKSQADFARACELHITAINQLVALRIAPINASGEFIPTAKKIMEVLGACPSDLWTDRQLMMALPKNSGCTTIGEIEALALTGAFGQHLELPDVSRLVEANEDKQLLGAALLSLSPKQRAVIRAIIADKSIEEIAEMLDVTQKRVRQIEATAHFRLRNTKELAEANCVKC